MRMPGFNAQASLYRTRRLEGYMMTLANANAQGEALVEPQQLGLLLVSYHLTNCGQADQFGGPCFMPGQPKTCQLTACRQAPSLHGGISCQVIGTVDYPITGATTGTGCIRDCNVRPH